MPSTTIYSLDSFLICYLVISFLNSVPMAAVEHGTVAAALVHVTRRSDLVTYPFQLDSSNHSSSYFSSLISKSYLAIQPY